MRRTLEKDLLAWKDAKRRKPLVLRGARQVGKTWLVEQFLARHFDSFVKVDLEKRRDLHRAFEDNLEPKRILNFLELACGRILPGHTLLFLDEIQACPRAIMALRYLYEEMPQLHLVAAGSLLEFAFSEISVPVGRLQYLSLYPMTFREFLWAMEKEPLAEILAGDPAGVPVEAHALVLQQLRSYWAVGGMPECVRVMRETGSLLEVTQVQEELLDSFRDDFVKYSPRTSSECLESVLQAVARGVGDQLKYTRLDDQHTGPTIRKAFDLLAKAKLVNKIAACNPSDLPLGASANPRRFKASLLDIGLMQRLCQMPYGVPIYEDDLLNIFKGRLAEQFVAQELLASGPGELYYWSREAPSSNAEVDFLVVNNGVIRPVEVKSGAAGTLRSLHLMLETYPGCPEGLVLSSRPFAVLEQQRLRFLPIYYASELQTSKFLSS